VKSRPAEMLRLSATEFSGSRDAAIPNAAVRKLKD